MYNRILSITQNRNKAIWLIILQYCSLYFKLVSSSFHLHKDGNVTQLEPELLELSNKYHTIMTICDIVVVSLNF